MKVPRQITINFGDNAKERLESLMEQTKAKNVVDVIQKALSFYHFCVERVNNYETIVIKTAEGEKVLDILKEE